MFLKCRSVGYTLQGVVMEELIGQKEFLDYLAANHKQMNVNDVLAELIKTQQIIIDNLLNQSPYEKPKQTPKQTWGKF